MKRFLLVLMWAVLGWIAFSVVIGIGFSILLAMAGESDNNLESTVGGLAGLAGIITGITYGVRTTAPKVER